MAKPSVPSSLMKSLSPWSSMHRLFNDPSNCSMFMIRSLWWVNFMKGLVRSPWRNLPGFSVVERSDRCFVLRTMRPWLIVVVRDLAHIPKSHVLLRVLLGKSNGGVIIHYRTPLLWFFVTWRMAYQWKTRYNVPRIRQSIVL